MTSTLTELALPTLALLLLAIVVIVALRIRNRGYAGSPLRAETRNRRNLGHGPDRRILVVPQIDDHLN